LGLEARALSPTTIGQLVMLAAEVRSYQRAVVVYERLTGRSVSPRTLQRLARQVGAELVAERDAAEGSAFEKPIEESPLTVAVECDGGRIMTRSAGRGPGVHEAAWKETKCAGLFRMTSHTFDEDPLPDLPTAFCNPQKVAQLAEKACPEDFLDESPPEDSALPDDEPDDSSTDRRRPKPLHRTCLASMANSDTFGKQMQREAKRRRFFEAKERGFLGDGLPWNWSVQSKYFPDFVGILDFIHVVAYLYSAAVVIKDDPQAAWAVYRGLAHAAWQGRVAEVIEALRTWLLEQGIDPNEGCAKEAAEYDVFVAWRYLTNNQARMDYPSYRKRGLPVTSSLIESLVKQLNHRVKGTEMFWDDPAGAEAILQLRAAVLSDDDRLIAYLHHRPGRPHIRPTPKTLAA
jgi:hypothetical protein